MLGRQVLVGRYVVRRPLAAATMPGPGVLVGWDRLRRREVVLKPLGPGQHAGPRLDHPHVASPLEALEVRGTTWVVADLVGGGTLRDLAAREGRLPPAYVGVVARQLLDALDAVHAAGWVHRDVKPANLLLEQTGRGRPHVVLSDFGVAVRAGTPQDEAVGTAGYVAPEVFDGSRADPAQDVWAAGVLIRQLHDEPGPLTTLSHAMTRREPSRRPSASTALRRMSALPQPRAGWWPEVRAVG